jgi:hypothetical protein
MTDTKKTASETTVSEPATGAEWFGSMPSDHGDEWFGKIAPAAAPEAKADAAKPKAESPKD